MSQQLQAVGNKKCPIWPALDLNLRLPASETNALPLDQLAGLSTPMPTAINNDKGLLSFRFENQVDSTQYHRLFCRALVYCKLCHEGVTNPDLVKMCECKKKSELGSK